VRAPDLAQCENFRSGEKVAQATVILEFSSVETVLQDRPGCYVHSLALDLPTISGVLTVTFQEAVQTVLTQKYADFTGRARRSEFWFWYLAVLVVEFVLYILAIAISQAFLILYLLVALGLIIPTLAAGVRRLHDTGKTGWLILVGIIPLIGTIALIIMFAQDSTPGANEYGPSPKGLADGGYAPGVTPNWG
jgi:uncharacterized membrane protein YhaH (DUF805 family)